MIRLLELLWPAFTPLLLLWVLHLRNGYLRRKGREPLALSRHRFYAWAASLLIAVVCLISAALLQPRHERAHYVPARTVDGTLVPGHFDTDTQRKD